MLTWSCSDFREEPNKYRISDIFTADFYFWGCVGVANQLRSTNPVTSTVLTAINIVLPFAMWILKSLHGTVFRYPYIILYMHYFVVLLTHPRLLAINVKHIM
jgi:hypothetical protein